MSLARFLITIGTGERTELEKDVWSDRFVRGILDAQGKTFPIYIRYRGGHTRNYPKKSYEIRMLGKTYHLNAEFDDPSMIRNALSFRFFETIGVPSPYTRHCVLVINGSYEGVYLLIEAVKRSFFRRRGIAVKSLTYAVNDRANFSLIDPDTEKRKRSLFSGYNLIIGSSNDRRKLVSFLKSIHLLHGNRLQTYLRRKLDVDNYLRWLAGAVLTGNYDGFEQNYAIYEHRPSGRYRMVPWDYEGTWGRDCYGGRVRSDLVQVEGYNSLTEKLLQNPKVRLQYKNMLLQYLQTAFTEKQIMPVVRRLSNRLVPDIYQDHTRKWPPQVFDGEPEIIRKYIEERRQIVMQELKKW